MWILKILSKIHLRNRKNDRLLPCYWRLRISTTRILLTQSNANFMKIRTAEPKHFFEKYKKVQRRPLSESISQMATGLSTQRPDSRSTEFADNESLIFQKCENLFSQFLHDEIQVNKLLKSRNHNLKQSIKVWDEITLKSIKVWDEITLKLNQIQPKYEVDSIHFFTDLMYLIRK